MIIELPDDYDISNDKDIVKSNHSQKTGPNSNSSSIPNVAIISSNQVQPDSTMVVAAIAAENAELKKDELHSPPLITEIPSHVSIKTDVGVPTAASDRKKFSFTYLKDAKFPGFDDKETQACLFKWGMQDHCYIKRFTYDQYLKPYDIDMFLLDFFNANPQIKVQGTMDRWGTLGNVTNVSKEETNHTITSLDFFDRLLTNGIVRSNGQITKCMDEYHDSFLVADNLRKCLLMPEFDLYDLFSPDDRREFIFHVFQAMCLGGRLCQYENDLEPYLQVTKKLYKDLITVVKDPLTNKLKVASFIYKITQVKSSVSQLFPLEHPQNFCYVSIDPMRRHINLLYHASAVYY
ncbi:hypothetical protein BATDEDRAFT_84667 [Batrachochytrium dendrobatidis JAM81]|uniref:Cilia- and flagella-associated protein 300 n=2 Tax=Batrachochytrium dendrobatidis TaxID=109871 RepID=F4NTS7_BATDJ|nr:uncharacterized protein BATDEDRAFT_84667 [Batrachochytrium dendrobatidis JAM81]EGF83953.1 hypothetical protein BATDEDRAFT_84667 [Batrachochytrium dendrobatidis JAM81]KAK5671735.1 hypothetical protein QVD99_001571 [Batrachochytrium dendrobatidis]OAJ36265.1 hypothetical protein BDEG_20457 [Batrachochytrium dendrobatidis JEL423]|eukprot:XP_006676288.1 hypothetical protein BATDEDRAFT_84667 [Batrachochytrium dendrobatidis JAM81]